MARLKLEGVTVCYGDNQPLSDVRLAGGRGSIGIMGPSGSGKSTLLRVVAGLQAPSKGVVLVDDQVVSMVSWRSPSDPRVAMIYQDYRLVPFLSVAQNVSLAAEVRGIELGEGDVAEVLDAVGIPPLMHDRRPLSLSGGEQQRVAIARCLVCRPSIVVADEPSGALDSANSLIVAKLLADLGRDRDALVVVATHDPVVAAEMDTVFVLDGGSLTKLVI